MSKRIAIFNNSFWPDERVRNVVTGFVGTVIEVDPNSYNPPPGQAVRNPYLVKYDHWLTEHGVWEPEKELEAVTDAPPKRRDAAKERQWDRTRAARSAARNERQNAAARAAGFTSARNLLTELEKGNVTVVRKQAT